MNYVDELSHELEDVGIRGRLRRRIVAEITDHLASDPDATLGPPDDLARQFADELGTARARRAGYAVFGALVSAGTLCIAAAAAAHSAGVRLPRLHPASELLGDLGVALLAIGSQLAFVAGVLALLRAVRLRQARALPRAEAIVIARRSVVGLLAGAACMVGLALTAIEYERGVSGWWTVLALGAAAAGGCALLAAAPAALSAVQLRPASPGEAGDLFADFGNFVPRPLRGRHWLFASLVALAIALVITLAGVVQSDPFDGAVRGLADGLACVAGFALLGRYLGLRAAT